MVDGPDARGAPRAAVVLPVKSFAQAKRRLAGVLDEQERAALAGAMAATVLRAAAPLPVVVVCDDDAVRGWAAGLGAEVLWTPGTGLDGAVEAGVAHVAAAGFDRAVVAHADLPLARDLAWVAAGDGVTLVPDRHGDGTNVACVPATAGFRFAYGAGSCARHEAEARRLALAVRLVPDERLGWDVDRPEDLDLPTGRRLAAVP
jgi:2-phospho-L-lactate/phosphoenolpyruvate guanylyltransferase